MKANKTWSNDFYRAVEDFEYDVDDIVTFRTKLLSLSFGIANTEWLIKKMTDARSALLD